MPIKSIVVVLDESSKTAGPYAVSLASMFEAHLTATTIVHDPTASVAWPEASLPLVASALDDARAEARRILDRFAATAKGISVETEPVEVSAGLPGRAIGPLARHFDLTVLEQPNPDAPDDREIMIETALFETGRPLLIVPYVPIAPFRLETVLIAWDGSATAARALNDAMPFLARAKRAEVVTVAEAGVEIDRSGDRIVRHLARHGISSAFRSLPSAGEIASTMLSHAFDAQADLLVMGGYGHSRLREFVLGGATRGILDAMTLPVLMSH
ncbi:universal stress protein [Microvirga mediterraneensis]|uniref:Universal stress protein n=1 Tax=Microvirga mediterraneensis TaxID=2754695 RepID=A0A838BVR3_9HYPH|nr:universal stress protein [Microvirga mediterraneensis]MBA1158965.1 universal stress protein [Microvirga mediterraneensis]